ncbi:MAG: hypothetical protein HC830_06840 [Bacteroidetes bacterium]|nr:hypothetical protein [Bacteroidota bacterium]
MTTLYTDNGIPTPYVVRGVYLNPSGVAAMLDTVVGFSSVTSQNIVNSKMSSIQDKIGYDWKSVEINQSANTARYAVRRNYTYIIRDMEINTTSYAF